MKVINESEHYIIFGEIDFNPETILDVLEKLKDDGYKAVEVGRNGRIICEKPDYEFM